MPGFKEVFNEHTGMTVSDTARKAVVDHIYIICWMIYFGYQFLPTTMFPDSPAAYKLYVLSILTTICIVGYKLIISFEKSWLETILVLALFVIAARYWWVRNDWSVMGYFIMIIGAKDIDFDRIVKVTLAVGISFMVAAYVASRMGYISNLVYESRHGMKSQALGMCYTTDCAAHVFFFALGYCWLRGGRLHGVEYVVLTALALGVYYLTKARNNTICLLLFIAATFAYQFWILKLKEASRAKVCRTLGILAAAFMILCVAVTIVLTVVYPTDNALFMKIDAILGSRYGMGHEGFLKYGVHLVGNDIPQTGLGRTTVMPDWYFFLDISYITVLLCKGLLFFAAMLIMTGISAAKGMKKNFYALIIFGVIALQCTVEHHWAEAAYNYFILMTFTRMRDGLPALKAATFETANLCDSPEASKENHGRA